MGSEPTRPVRQSDGTNSPSGTPTPGAYHSSLAEALAAFQRTLPKVAKKATGQVGNQKYKYARLEDVTAVVLPKLNALGFVWTTTPTAMPAEAGPTGFGLLYTLTHWPSGEEIKGIYPIAVGKPQEMGSAITYARRYALCAVIGVTPAGDDDDGRAASAPSQAPAAAPVRDLVPEFRDRMRNAATMAELQAAWEAVGAAGMGRDPELVQIKETMKWELSQTPKFE